MLKLLQTLPPSFHGLQEQARTQDFQKCATPTINLIGQRKINNWHLEGKLPDSTRTSDHAVTHLNHVALM